MRKTSRTALALILPAITLAGFSLQPAKAGFEWTPPVKMQAPETTIPEYEGFPPPAAQPVMPVDQVPLPTMASPAPVMPLEQARIPQPLAPRVNPYAAASPTPRDTGNQQVTYHGKPLRRERPETAIPPMQQQFVTPSPAAYTPPATNVPVIDLYPLMRTEPYKPAQIANRGFGYSAPPNAPLPAPGTIPQPAGAPAERSYPGTPVTKTALNTIPFYKEAVGFGTDIPLALAVGQIIPPEYPYSFSENINPGIRINWNGGRPWNVVLQEAISPHGLDLVIEQNGVMIVPAYKDVVHATAQTPAQMTQPSRSLMPPVDRSNPSYPPLRAPAGQESMTPIPLTNGWGS